MQQSLPQWLGAARWSISLVAAAMIACPAMGAVDDFAWARAFSGTTQGVGTANAVDAEGNVYTTGFFEGTVDFDPGITTFPLTALGSMDVFVSKLDKDGAFLWARAFRGAGSNEAWDIAVDGAGNAYIVGNFQADMEVSTGPSAFRLTATGISDMFVVKLDTNGGFVWARAFGGSGAERGWGIALDAGGRVHVAGDFEGTVDFDPGPGLAELTATATERNAVFQLDPDGNLNWARRMGGAMPGFGAPGGTIAVDGEGYVYTTGHFSGTADFDPGPGTFELTDPGFGSAFVAKLDASGEFVWARAIESSDFAVGYAVAVDGRGDVHVTGAFSGITDFDPGPQTFILTSQGDTEIFVLKLDTDGEFVWARRMTGVGFTGFDAGLGIALDDDGNVFTTGYFEGSTYFDPGVDSIRLESAGDRDAFVSVLDATGAFVASGSFSGLQECAGLGIALDPAGNVHVTGYFFGSADFDPGNGVLTLTAAAFRDIFAVKLGTNELSAPVIPEEINGDGEVNAVDVQLVINAALGIPIPVGLTADINADGLVNAVDVQLVIVAALGLSSDDD